VESCHRGIAAIVDADGAVVFAAGDIDAPVYPRSAVKALLALPLIESGAADRYGLTEPEIALACASHSGEPVHVATAAGMLRKAGQAESCLECGAQWPIGEGAARELAASGKEPGRLHNNCSGKHAGFICMACHEGVAPAGYVRPEHPVMREVTAALADVTGARLDESNRAVDGCAIPTYAIPLRALALGFARFGTGRGLGTARLEASRRIRAAVAAHPHMVAGSGRFDTVLMTALGARAFTKTGAEGVHVAAVPELGLGIAVKCADGAARAADLATAALLARFLEGVPPDLVRRPVTNWSGEAVGEIRPAELLRTGGTA
jgi:L-asparaginase II